MLLLHCSDYVRVGKCENDQQQQSERGDGEMSAGSCAGAFLGDRVD